MDTFLVTSAEQVRALASPIRSQILDVLRAGGEQSVSELAEGIGATGAATHYHVNKLVSAGLVLKGGQRKVGPRVERLFHAVAPQIKIAARPDSTDYTDALLDLALSRLRVLERELVCAHGLPADSADVPPARITVGKGFVRVEDLPRMQQLLEEAAHMLRREPHGQDDVQIVLRSFVVRVG